jgi:hypothetical protein
LDTFHPDILYLQNLCFCNEWQKCQVLSARKVVQYTDINMKALTCSNKLKLNTNET